MNDVSNIDLPVDDKLQPYGSRPWSLNGRIEYSESYRNRNRINFFVLNLWVGFVDELVIAPCSANVQIVEICWSIVGRLHDEGVRVASDDLVVVDAIWIQPKLLEVGG